MKTPDCLTSFLRRLRVSYVTLRILMVGTMGLIGYAIFVTSWNYWVLSGILLLILVIISLGHIGSRLQCMAHLLSNPSSIFWVHPHMDNPISKKGAINQKECWVMHLLDGRSLDMNLLPEEAEGVIMWIKGINPDLQINEFRQHPVKSKNSSGGEDQQ